MKKIKIFLMTLVTLLALSISAAEAANTITVGWEPNVESDVLSYNVYFKPAVSPTWGITNVVGRTNSSATLPVVPLTLYQYYVTAAGTNSLESEPSNQIRYQLFYVNASKPTIFTLADVNVSNFPSFVPGLRPAFGTLGGTVPMVVFTPSNNITFTKDVFSYSNPEVFANRNITNYYGLIKNPIVFTVPNIKFLQVNN